MTGQTGDQMWTVPWLFAFAGLVGLTAFLWAAAVHLAAGSVVDVVRDTVTALARLDRAVLTAAARPVLVAGQRVAIARQRRAALGQRGDPIALGSGGERR